MHARGGGQKRPTAGRRLLGGPERAFGKLVEAGGILDNGIRHGSSGWEGVWHLARVSESGEKLPWKWESRMRYRQWLIVLLAAVMSGCVAGGRLGEHYAPATTSPFDPLDLFNASSPFSGRSSPLLAAELFPDPKVAALRGPWSKMIGMPPPNRSIKA